MCYSLLAYANAGICPHVASQYYARQKAVRCPAMLRVDKLPYQCQQIESNQWYHIDEQTQDIEMKNIFDLDTTPFHFLFTNFGVVAPHGTSNYCPISPVLLMNASNPRTLAYRQAYHSRIFHVKWKFHTHSGWYRIKISTNKKKVKVKA